MARTSGAGTDRVLAAKTGGGPGEPEDDGALVFRAVSVGGERRGIRLEAIFWKTLSAMSAAWGRTLGDQVGETMATRPQAGNLASTLRVQAAQWLADRVAELERITALEAVYAIVHASPAPAFVLSADKRIVQYNQPFLGFVRSRLVTAESTDVLRSARLSLDTQLEQIIELLRGNPRAPVVTGFAFGVSERRVRGQLRMVLAPTASATMVIAYVSQV